MSWQAALAGVGIGLGQAGQAAAQQRETAEDRALKQRQLDQTLAHQTRMEEIADRRGRTTINPYLAKILGLPEGEVMDTSLVVPMVQRAEERSQHEATSRGISDAYDATRALPAVPPQPTGALTPGEDPEAGAFIGATPPTPARPFQREEFRSRVMGIPGLSAGQAQLAQDMGKAPALHNLNEWGAVDLETGERFAPPESARQPKVSTFHYPTDQGTYLVLHDDRGNQIGEPRLLPGGPPPRAPKDPQQPTTAVLREKYTDAALRGRGYAPDHPDPKNRQIYFETMANAVNITQGPSGVYGAADLMMPAPWEDRGAIPQPTGRPGDLTPRPQPRSLVTPPPDAGERKDLAEMDAAITTANNLAAQANQHRAVLGGMISNPVGALRRLAGPYSEGALTKDERKFLANFGLQVAQLRRELIGLTQTDRELKALVDSLPAAGNVDESTIAQLEAIRDHMLTKRQARGNVLRQSGRRDPAGPASNPAPSSPPRNGTMSDADRRAAQKFGL